MPLESGLASLMGRGASPQPVSALYTRESRKSEERTDWFMFILPLHCTHQPHVRELRT